MSCIVAIPVASSLSDFDEDKFTRTCRAPRVAARFVNADHRPSLLLPADFRDWVPAGQVGEQLAKAEDADSILLQVGLTILYEIRRREDRLAKLKQARPAIEKFAKARFAEELAARAERERSTGKMPGGKPPELASKVPRPGTVTTTPISKAGS